MRLLSRIWIIIARIDGGGYWGGLERSRCECVRMASDEKQHLYHREHRGTQGKAFGWYLFPYAEGGENAGQDVVGSGGAGDFVQGAEGLVEIEEEHLVGDAGDYGGDGGVELR